MFPVTAGAHRCFPASRDAPAKDAISGVIDAFAAALKRGDAPPASGEEALIAMRTVFAAAESAETGREVPVGN